MSKKTNISIVAVIAVLAAAYIVTDTNEQNFKTTPSVQVEPYSIQAQSEPIAQTNNKATHVDDTHKIAQVFQTKQGDLQVQAQGKVVAILKDDNEGSRHQKFILELSNGQTVLVAHNIDLAPRIEHLTKGDTVEFFGEYEYSDKGGVIHWTHHDPAGRHVDGWLKHHKKTYQ